MEWLNNNFPQKDCIVYYGFDEKEKARVQRRSGIMGNLGYKTDYPLALWENLTIGSTEEIGILKPNTYESFRHANCIGCLKGGKLHWYIVYCYRRDIFEKSKLAEDEIGYTILASDSMTELEPIFAKMYDAGVVGSEHEDGRTFWARVKRSGVLLEQDENDRRPCECIF